MRTEKNRVPGTCYRVPFAGCQVPGTSYGTMKITGDFELFFPATGNRELVIVT